MFFYQNKTNMKRIGKILLGILGLLIVFVLYTMITTGFFRSIENQFDGEIVKKVKVPGAEDMQLSYEDHFMIISSDDRASRRDGNPQQGGLYYVDLKNPLADPIRLTDDSNCPKPFYPHGISMIKLDSTKYKIYAISHVEDKHTLEVFYLFGDSLVYDKALSDPMIKSPNDIVAIDENRFYFTNDHGYTSGVKKLAEDYMGLRASNVVYFDGKNYKEVADGIAYANGINYTAAKELLFVASPRDFLVKVYKTKSNGDLDFVENINCGTGVDNIEFDEAGKIWIGCHPSLLGFSAYAGGGKPFAPSEIITIDYKGENDYETEMVFLDTGENMAAATVAPTYGDYIFVGNVMDEHYLVLRVCLNLKKL